MLLCRLGLTWLLAAGFAALRGVAAESATPLAVAPAAAAAVPAPAPVPPASYKARLAEAKRFASENSWALAREAYAGALPLAPDSEARRWCELWLEDATWRAEGEPENWQTMRSWEARHRAVFDRLLEPYARGQPRDDFWAAATEARGFIVGREDWRALGEWAEVATYLGEQPYTAAASDRLIRFLQRTLGTRYSPHWQRFVSSPFLPLLARGADIGNTPDQRAWCALTLANMAGGEPKEMAANWKRALDLAGGTQWALLAKAQEFSWRSEIGWDPAAVLGSAVNVPALLRESVSIREALAQVPTEVSSKEVARRLRDFEERLAAPVLGVKCSGRFLPGDAMSFVYGATGFDRLEVAIYEHTPETWGHWNLKPKENPLDRVARRIRTWTIALPPAAELRWKSEVIPLPQPLQPGLYTLAVRGLGLAEEAAQNVNFVVSDLGGALVAESGGRRTFFLFNQTSRAPVADKRAGGVVVGDKSVRSWTGPTDATGRIDLPSSEESDQAGESICVAVVEGQPVPVETHVFDRELEGGSVADFFLDRPLYRPGETARWKMIVRERQDGHWVVPKEKREMSVVLNNEPLVEKVAVALNRYGTAHGEIAIPADARPGKAWVVLKPAGGDNRDSREELLFSVDNFVPPALAAKLELASGADSLRPGREVVARVTATYLSGGPAVGVHAYAKLDAEVGPEAYLLAPIGEIEGFEQWIAKERAEMRESMTDASGAAEFRLRLPERVPGPLALRFDAAVLPEGGQPVAAKAKWGVFSAGRVLDVEGWMRQRLVRPTDAVTFACRVYDGTGKPAAFTGVAQLVERRWVGLFLNPQGQVVDRLPDESERAMQPWQREPSVPEGWMKIHADYVETMVAEKPVEAAPDGQLKIVFTPPRPGIFRLKVVDANGKALSDPSAQYWVERPLTIVAADEATHTLPFRPSAIEVCVPEPARAGGPLTVFVVLPEGETAGVMTVTGEDETVSRRVDFPGRAGMVTFSQWPHCAGYGRIEVMPLSGRQSTEQTQFSVEQDRGEMQLELAADSAKSRPGAAARIELKVNRKAGVGVRSELALAVSDEAVNGRIRRPTEEGVAFLRDRIGTEPGIAQSLEPSLEKPEVLGDPRQGAVVHFGALGPVAIRPESRERTRGGDIASRAAGITSGFLQDTGATNNPALLRSATDAESGGVQDGFIAKPSPAIEIRRHFGSTAAWVPEIVTNEKGEATVEFKYPDNLTQWRIEAYAVGEDGNSFGRAAAFTRTSLPFQARLQAPRFLVEGDTAVPSALLVNRTDAELKADAELKVEGAAAPVAAVGAHLGAPSSGGTGDRAQDIGTQQAAPLRVEGIAVPKQSEARAAWTVKAVRPGEANLTLTARAGAEGDGMALTLPVLEDGIQQETAASGRLAGDARERTLELPLPEKLDRARTTVTVQLSPGHAAAVLDALPYLVDYPYGCVEQTMSRFLPAAVVRKTLTDFGLDVAAVERRILAGESRRDAARREKTAGLERLDDVVQKSLARLNEAQRGDGGFGWWPGAEVTDLWMTAYVSWGLGLARTAGITVPDHLVKDTNVALVRSLADEPPSPDVTAWALAALARAKPDAVDSKAAGAAFQHAYEARAKLSATGRACLALAAARFGDDNQRAVLLRNLENGAQRAQSDDLGATVHWGATGDYWRAMDGAVESTALTLLALLELDPKHPFVEPAANWLALNRRSAHWASTRDTAFAVMALERYIAVRREFQPEAVVEVGVNGQPVREVRFTPDSLLGGPVTLPLSQESLRPGANRIELRRVSGTTPVYAVALASSWAAAEVVKPAGHLVAVDRGFVREKAQATLMGTLKITPEPMADGGPAVASEQVTAHVTLTVPNELEYVIIEVPKPAGCEPLDPLSGWDARIKRVEPDTARTMTANSGSASDPIGALHGPTETVLSSPAKADQGRAVYREEHDEKSVFFLDHLEAGTWEIRFGLRATTPGDFRALPAQAAAMYVPEVRANSDARRVRIEARPSESPTPAQ